MTPEKPNIQREANKIASLDQVSIIVAEGKERGRTSGLITGCFDVLHVSHINLFRSAKQHVDILIIGVERDESLKSKGPNRPINRLDWRCEVLSELTSVDSVFPIEFEIEYKPSDENDHLYEAMYERIKPDFLITNLVADDYWELKLRRAEKMGISFLGLESERLTSSTEIIDEILKEN
jgi:cytidyltransferase-like protein